jgi:heterodisulfide reductase subunit A
MSRDVLIIGGGVAGMQAALDLGDRGLKVHLVEKTPSIGGTMALLDKTFPTNDCSICILAPKMNECFGHSNTEIHTYSEVLSVEGEPGKFKVKILEKARFVDVNKCTGCGDCIEKCPVKKIPNEYNQNLDNRRAIYLPFPQAVPRKTTIDKEYCKYLLTGKCGVCKKICKAGAIDFEQEDKEIELEVGAIIVAIGLSNFDPTPLTEYGYGRYANVHTNMEYERLICASGPTGGHLECEPDKRHPKRMAYIPCVGSRDKRPGACDYCCSVCCMLSTKDAMLAREHYDDIESFIFYADLRTSGKGAHEYAERARDDYAVTYIHGRPGEIREVPETKELDIFYIDEADRKLKSIRVDFVVLSAAIPPALDTLDLSKLIGIETDELDGFVKVIGTEIAPVDTSRPGILVAGYCEGPKDVTESVIQASGAAARAAEVIYKYGGGE